MCDAHIDIIDNDADVIRRLAIGPKHHKILGHLFARAFDIGIFDTQNKSSVVLSRIEPVEKRGPGSADVKVAGGRRRKPDSNSLIGHRLSLRSAPTASRTTSVLGSSARGRISL